MRMISIIKKALNALVRRSYWYNNIEFADCSKFWNHKSFGLDVVNLGSSSAVTAFDYSYYPQLKTANWAMAPQTTLADYEVLRNYSCFLRESATVIIPLCPFSCLGGSNEYLSDKYYSILDIASIPNASYVKKQQVMDIKRNPIMYYPFMQLFFRQTNEKIKVMDQDSLEKDAKMRMERWRKEFSIIRFSDPLSLVNQDAYNDTVDLLKKMVHYCLERKLRPVLVIPPVSSALQVQFSSDLKKLFLDDFVAKVVENELFLDYFKDNRFDSVDFRNSFMLSPIGSKKFTEIVLKDLGIIE